MKTRIKELKMSEKKRGLGRGLSALIGDSAAQPVSPQDASQEARQEPATQNAAVPAQENTSSSGDGGLTYLGIDQLRPGKYQPRKNFDADELAALSASLEKSGVLQPLLVRPIDGPDGQEDGQYEIIAGERRWRAAQKAKLHQVPVIVQAINDVTALELAIIENVQRADLNPMEEAEGYQRLIDEFAYTQAELAETIGKSRSHIANLLRLIGAPDAVRTALVAGTISMGHARALLASDNAAALVKQIIAEGLSVRAVEKLVGAAKPASGKKSAAARASGGPEKNADTRALEKTISDALGLSVSIDDRGVDKGGAVTIDYKSLEQLDDLVTRLIGR
jgi:ParB family chromosome partitioning protein